MSKLTLVTEGDKHVVVTRRFAAPPEAVYRAHTEPRLIQKWLLGPDGWTMPVCVCEARPGGKIRYEWADGKGGGFYLTGEFVELVPFSRIVHVERMHLPDPMSRQSRRNKVRAGRERDADDDENDIARCPNAGGHAGERHGARDGSELRPARDHGLSIAASHARAGEGRTAFVQAVRPARATHHVFSNLPSGAKSAYVVFPPRVASQRKLAARMSSAELVPRRRAAHLPLHLA